MVTALVKVFSDVVDALDNGNSHTCTTEFNSSVRYGRPSNSFSETAAFIRHWWNGTSLVRVVRDQSNTICTFIQQHNTSISISVRYSTRNCAWAASFRTVYRGHWLNYCSSWFAASLLRWWHADLFILSPVELGISERSSSLLYRRHSSMNASKQIAP